MRAIVRVCALLICGAGLLAWPAVAAADHGTRPSFELRALGHSPNPASFLPQSPEVPQGEPPGPAVAEINSDLAFWGDYAFNGNYDGFRIIDISDPWDPVEISHTRCQGNQGDIVVWGDILVRSWNSPAPALSETNTRLADCDGEPVPAGWEGLHIFDISNLTDPELIGSVQLPCGSHTATGVPDRRNGRLIIYNQASGSVCKFMDIVEVPLDRPQDARKLREEPMMADDPMMEPHGCHDSGVILGKVNMMACASGAHTNVFDIGANDMPGGSIEDPEFLYTIEEPGVGPKPGEEHSGSWHSATFTWDGKVIVLGWEPGGGADPECEATDPDVTKSNFFYDARTGEKLGQWTLPRPQTAEENCTIHNYNIVPIRDRYIMVGGHYQAGTWAVDFTNPAEPWVRGYADPAPLQPTQLGGAWSTYWYNGFLFESDITEGLNIFRLADNRTKQRAKKLRHLNPQTQELTLGGLPGNALEQAARERERMEAPNQPM